MRAQARTNILVCLFSILFLGGDMRHRWRDFEVFDEDPREKQEVSNDMGLCPIWDRTCSNRVSNVWKASQQELAPSFIDEAIRTKLDIMEADVRQENTNYARRRFCERAIERTKNS